MVSPDSVATRSNLEISLGISWIGFSVFLAYYLHQMSRTADYSVFFSQLLVSALAAAVLGFLTARYVRYTRRRLSDPDRKLRLQINYKVILLGVAVMALPFCWEPFVIITWLIICYLAIIPVFLDKNVSPDLATGLVASCFGIMISGFIYVLTIRFDIPSAWFVPLPMLCLALVTLARYRIQVIPVLNFRNRYNFFYLILFLTYGGLILVACMKMGMGEYPPVFFNMDVPHLLAQAHQLTWTEIYPPESITTKGLIHAYHDGGPATVASISHVTNLPVHKIMFWVVSPLFLAASFAVFILLVHKLIDGPIRRLIGLTFVLPFVLLGSYSLDLFFSGDIVSNLTRDIIGSSSAGKYDPESFGRGVLALNNTAGNFLLGAGALLVVDQVPRRTLTLIPIVACLIVFMKLDMAPAVYVFLGVAILFMWRFFRELQYPALFFLVGIFVLVATPILTMFVLGYADTVSYTGATTVRPIAKIMEGLTSFWRKDEIYIAALISVPMAIAWACSKRSAQVTQASRLVLATLAMMIVCSLVPVVIFIPKVGGQILDALWLGVPLACIALLSISSGRTGYASYIIIAPLFLAAVIAQWNRLHHVSVAIVLPEYVNEYVDNRLLGEALSVIPRRDLKTTPKPLDYKRYVQRFPDLLSAFKRNAGGKTIEEWGKQHYDKHGKREARTLSPNPIPILVTNDFRFLKYPHSSPQISSLFGHQAYSVHIRHFVGPRGFNLDAWRLMNHQLERLSRSFSKSNPDFTKETIRQATWAKWTHFILRKDVDDGLPPRQADEIPLKKIFENERYAVFEF